MGGEGAYGVEGGEGAGGVPGDERSGERLARAAGAAPDGPLTGPDAEGAAGAGGGSGADSRARAAGLEC
ncbi:MULTISPECIES: hypothetical protein [Actinomadura]|uniref:Uncharacterized protein n=1 Tax=Actinomadura yumaensis TaxID=111807 RepID=A0ABW2CSY3_9ACTN|nr:hypothetical protein [Actinomadura sp. J1-007]